VLFEPAEVPRLPWPPIATKVPGRVAVETALVDFFGAAKAGATNKKPATIAIVGTQRDNFMQISFEQMDGKLFLTFLIFKQEVKPSSLAKKERSNWK
jgi:hypothetical protein